eukprot:TRINITY_DN5245_c0_g1_i2.p1 TRINITY_DN5245_c0_g1~~TRINITY_DN5245_c0_g1_i2.p1  ORF type:complete len:398 (+),score=52.71 TRINITY_DN5245_c0_g1_i2:135-1328(+)
MCIRDRYQRRVHGIFKDMESVSCQRHDRPNEIVCLTCKKYLCPMCFTDHCKDGHTASYSHILEYSKKHTLSKIDILKENVIETKDKIASEVKIIVDAISEMLPGLKKISEESFHCSQQMNSQVSKLKSFSKTKDADVSCEKIIETIEKDKDVISKNIEKCNFSEVVKMSLKYEKESEMMKNQMKASDIYREMDSSLNEIEKSDHFSKLNKALNLLSTKCYFLHLMNYSNNWRLDKQYLTSKMSLSEDGLTFGNTATNGHPGIIGDVPWESGLWAYEVIPIHLCCSGKDGFGIMELKRYQEIFKNDSVTPSIFNDIIGFLWTDQVKNMTAKTSCPMQLNSKYYVRINLVDYYMTITGPGVSLRTELKPGVAYVPALSCGCSSNRLVIRPLEYFEEGEK